MLQNIWKRRTSIEVLVTLNIMIMAIIVMVITIIIILIMIVTIREEGLTEFIYVYQYKRKFESNLCLQLISRGKEYTYPLLGGHCNSTSIAPKAIFFPNKWL